MAAVGELQLHYTDMDSYFLHHGANSSGSGCESGSASSSFGGPTTGDVNCDQTVPFDLSEYFRDDVSTHTSFSEYVDNGLFQAVQSNGVNLLVGGGSSMRYGEFCAYLLIINPKDYLQYNLENIYMVS